MVECIPIVAGMWGPYVRREDLNRATAVEDSVCGSCRMNYLSEEVLCSDMPIGPIGDV